MYVSKRLINDLENTRGIILSSSYVCEFIIRIGYNPNLLKDYSKPRQLEIKKIIQSIDKLNSSCKIKMLRIMRSEIEDKKLRLKKKQLKRK